MRKSFFSILLLQALQLTAQTDILTTTGPDGRLMLSKKGASYFANLSLDCTQKPYPHYYMETLEKAEDLKPPEKMWPSFYGCFDWHSGVHNHWALVKLLKKYPDIPEAKAIQEKLEQSFNEKNILAELAYLKSHEDRDFEFPYGTSWLLKVADELIRWNNPTAKTWLKNLKPLTDYIAERYILVWPLIPKATYTGDHFASSLGLSFALDYARSAKNDSLEIVTVAAAKKFYAPVTKFPLEKEPFGYDFMSAGLLITDLMRKVYTTDEYVKWLHGFSNDLFTISGLTRAFAVERLADHSGYASHWDGFHLNRIWCINGMLKSLPADALDPEVKKEWRASQREMWNYAQESIGKGNYDVDHWLSSFSVFALIGYED